MTSGALSASPIRVRFAPAPTGHLHVGGLRTALFNWLFARHNGGTFLLRIEDTDVERSRLEYMHSILTSLAWAGLDPDEPYLIQTQRTVEHQELIQQLLDSNRAYRCYCTSQELTQRCRRSEHTVEDEGDEEFFIQYDGHCRAQRSLADATKPFVVRFAIPDACTHVTFDDMIRGPITFDRMQFDDFIIARSDGRAMYNFVVVADDAFMRISHIIRGEEHISNTPKQILLAQACGFAVPQFAHLPMILGPSGQKLSKRDGAVSVLDYQKAGYLPEALINYLARLGWSHGNQEIFTKDELISLFSLEHVGKKGAIFDVNKLDWVNSTYLRKKTNEELLAYIHTYVMPDLSSKLSWTHETIGAVIGLYKNRVKTVGELAQAIVGLAQGPSSYDSAYLDQLRVDNTVGYIQEVVSLSQADTDQEAGQQWVRIIKVVAQQHNLAIADLAHPIRYAVTGMREGPSIADLCAIIGSSVMRARISALYNALIAHA